MRAEHQKLYEAAVASSHAWDVALQDKFGKDAGWIRYYPEGRSGEMAPLQEAFTQAAEQLSAFVVGQFLARAEREAADRAAHRRGHTSKKGKRQ